MSPATAPRSDEGVGLTTIRVVGGLLPTDLLARVAAGTELPGLRADDYRLELGVSPREAANRAWAVLTAAWRGYQDAVERLPADEQRATGLTRDKWLLVLLRELGFGRVPVTGPGGITTNDARSFPVSHLAPAGEVRLPAHLLGRGINLDRRNAGVAGAADRAPHAMVQELLNRSDDYLWAFVANAETLRLVRDSSTLVGPSFVEFDLAAMFDGEVFSDFVVLYLTCHQSRFEPRTADGGVADCWLEEWRAFAAETGTRALGALRDGVQSAIESLGTGFLQHPANAELRDRLGSARTLSVADYHRGLLRLVYRLLFVFVAEDRDLLLDPQAAISIRQRYRQWFGTARLRRVAARRQGTKHDDAWQALRLVLNALGREGGEPELGLPGLGGLFENGALDVTAELQLANDALFAAVRRLGVIRPTGSGPSRAVDYRNLGAEELGGIYESLLELVPTVDSGARTFGLVSAFGNERKTTGAYYTPSSLIDCLLDSALGPLLDEAETTDDPETSLLALTICDPACGSGHFLVAAARRIAFRVARVRAAAEGAEPSEADVQAAMHDVVGRCIYGVDLNEMATELAKVSLWLEALQPGKPLSFLDAHVKVGNALLGTTPALLQNGIPDSAYEALLGDDKPTVRSHKQRNREERAGQASALTARDEVIVDNQSLRDALKSVDAMAASLADVHVAAQRYSQFERSPERLRAKWIADAWCTAFVAARPAGAPPITTGLLQRWQAKSWDGVDDLDEFAGVVADATARHRFFHWHVEFPDIFVAAANDDAAAPAGWTGGFSCVIGNPPWEHVELKEQEFFAARDPDIATAPSGAARKRLIKALASDQPALFRLFEEKKRQFDAERGFLGASGRFPLCGRGRINTYAVFAETDRSLTAAVGRMGVIVPTGIATDATTQKFFRSLVEARSLVSLYDFENSKPMFEGVHRSFKFSLLTISGLDAEVHAADFAFFALDPDDLIRPDVRFALTPDEIMLLNPNTGTCPVFRTRRDADITLDIYRRVPPLLSHRRTDGNPWGLSFKQGLFNMTSDSHLFRGYNELRDKGWLLSGNVFERGPERMLPLYEGKMVHHYDHRWATTDAIDGTTRELSQLEKRDPACLAMPRYWTDEREVDASAQDHRTWFAGFRNVAPPTNARTIIVGAVPRSGTGNSFCLLKAASPDLLVACLTSLPLDFAARQKVGGSNINFFLVEQLPVLAPSAFASRTPWDVELHISEWVRRRSLELTFTAHDMKPYALDLGDEGAPFVWDDARRAALRAELDGAFFHLYGVEREDVDYILSTFPIVNRKDIAEHGEERTRRLVLEAYDAIAAAVESSEPFVSALDPPPGEGARHPGRG